MTATLLLVLAVVQLLSVSLLLLVQHSLTRVLRVLTPDHPDTDTDTDYPAPDYASPVPDALAEQALRRRRKGGQP